MESIEPPNYSLKSGLLSGVFRFGIGLLSVELQTPPLTPTIPQWGWTIRVQICPKFHSNHVAAHWRVRKDNPKLRSRDQSHCRCFHWLTQTSFPDRDMSMIFLFAQSFRWLWNCFQTIVKPLLTTWLISSKYIYHLNTLLEFHTKKKTTTTPPTPHHHDLPKILHPPTWTCQSPARRRTGQ